MKNWIFGCLAAVVSFCPALAADLPVRPEVAPVEVAPQWDGGWQIRVRASVVVPDGHASWYDRAGAILPVLGSSGGAGGQIFNAGAHVSTTVIPELDISYYFTKNWAIETICCFSHHSISGTGVLAGLNVGNTWVFPPTLLLQYHLTELGAFQPYVGVGLNLTAFFGTHAGNNWAPFVTPVLGATGFNAVTQLSIGTSVGVVGQVGFDYMINQNWGINFDLKRFLMQPTAYGTLVNTVATPLVGPLPVRAQVNINPWIASVGVTYRFGGASAPVVARY